MLPTLPTAQHPQVWTFQGCAQSALERHHTEATHQPLMKTLGGPLVVTSTSCLALEHAT